MLCEEWQSLLGHVPRLLNSRLNDKCLNREVSFIQEVENMSRVIFESMIILKVLWDISLDILSMLIGAIKAVVTLVVAAVRRHKNRQQ